MNKITLRSLFDSVKPEFLAKLQDYSLPKDIKAVHAAVEECLAFLFAADGEYRRKLTKSEDYIFMAAVNLLNSQQHLHIDLLSEAVAVFDRKSDEKKSWGVRLEAFIKKIRNEIDAMIKPKSSHSDTVQAFLGKGINVEVLVEKVSDICDKFDCVIETYRVQVQRIKQAYEEQEKPTFLGTYATLASNLEGLFEVSSLDNVDIDELQAYVDLVKRSLKNYGVIYEDGRLILKQ